MTRSLPERPNLEHLKNQAKERPGDGKLADKLHAVAREYGFATWPKLKEYVESLPRLSPFVGRWVANVAQSVRHPANQFRSARIEFAVEGDVVTLTDTFVSDSGEEVRGRNAFQVDGRPHPSANGNGYVLTARWRGSRALETVATRDGAMMGQALYEVSADGKRLTITAAEQRIVLERA